jgi:YHS domain-containing protein
MKTRLCIAALAVLTLVVGNSLRAADEKPALKCPVSGKAVDATKTVDFNGGKVAFCCENCPKAFSKDSAKFAGKANLQLVQSKQLKQVKCPLTGKPCAPDKSVEVAGVKVGLCCGNCLAKATKLTGDEQINLLFSEPKPGSFEAAAK